MNPYYAEQEMHRRAKEYEREADLHRMARLARGERRPFKWPDIGRLKCQMRDALAVLGLGLERCEVQPGRLAGR